MPADPILASNPLDKYVPDYHALVVMYGELWRKAAELQARLTRDAGPDWERWIGPCAHGRDPWTRCDTCEAAGELQALAWALDAANGARTTEAQTRAALETTIVTLRESAEFDAGMRRSISASVEEWKKECRRLEALIPTLVLREREECAALVEDGRWERIHPAKRRPAIAAAIRSRGGQ